MRVFSLMSEEHLTPADNVPGCVLGGEGALMKGQISMRSALTLKHDGGFTAAVCAHAHVLLVVDVQQVN